MGCRGWLVYVGCRVWGCGLECLGGACLERCSVCSERCSARLERCSVCSERCSARLERCSVCSERCSVCSERRSARSKNLRFSELTGFALCIHKLEKVSASCHFSNLWMRTAHCLRVHYIIYIGIWKGKFI